MDLAENRFRKTWERFLEVLKVKRAKSIQTTSDSYLRK